MKIFGIIGYPVAHSRSPELHNAWFRKKHIDAVYEIFEIEPERLSDFMKVFREKVNGASITIPYKIVIMDYLDEIDPVARKIGAVNTVINKNGKLIGYNTDIYGAIKALKDATELKDKKVLLLGAGGAAHAIAYGLVDEGAAVVILDQDFEKSKTLAKKTNARAEKMENLKNVFKKESSDIVINATPVGMHPDFKGQSLVPKELLKPEMVVFDIVYNPLKTKLLTDAEGKGCTIITGDKMLLYQAKKQFELFSA